VMPIESSAFKVLTVSIKSVLFFAIHGLMEQLGIDPENVEIGYSGEVDHVLAKKRFPHHEPTDNVRYLPNQLRLMFTNSQNFSQNLHVEGDRIYVPYSPYKYSLPKQASQDEVRALRGAMGITDERPILVVSSPNQDELQMILQAYESLDPATRPLLILGMLQPVPHLKDQLAEKGFKTLERNAKEEPLSDIGKHDIVVLNTRGELLDFFKTANLAIVGHDRNLFEPISQAVPVLYFRGMWSANYIVKRLAHDSKGGIEIEPGQLAEQIINILNDPDEMIQGTEEALRVFRIICRYYFAQPRQELSNHMFIFFRRKCDLLQRRPQSRTN